MTKPHMLTQIFIAYVYIFNTIFIFGLLKFSQIYVVFPGFRPLWIWFIWFRVYGMHLFSLFLSFFGQYASLVVYSMLVYSIRDTI